MALISFPQRLTDLATEDPDRLAVACGDVALTRRELDLASNRLARDLAGRGVTQGQMVTIALPNSVDWFVAFVASAAVRAVTWYCPGALNATPRENEPFSTATRISRT